ncbi:MAG: hypothetical protein BroJett040_25650 [Oligoflexia bacterium]|nr:MAG: hypothetical protein BroJett040_25650 [Oligoflexia bacterium]
MVKYGKAFWISFLSLILVSLGLASINLIPSWREKIHALFLHEQRVVLAKAAGDITGKGDQYSFVKVQTADTISIEAYEVSPKDGKVVFKSRTILPEKRDGYFTYKGNATNLALIDIDSDGTLEILAPSYDENLVPRLHVYKYDITSGAFEMLGPDHIQF